MEKLIELLNEYEVEKKPSRLQRNYYLWFVHNFWKWIMYIDEEWEDVDDYRTDYEIISKEYGFIKWLVDNDKIEFPTSCAIDKNNDYSEREIKSDYESLLMLLAISDKPIELLISVLK